MRSDGNRNRSERVFDERFEGGDVEFSKVEIASGGRGRLNGGSLVEQRERLFLEARQGDRYPR